MLRHSAARSYRHSFRCTYRYHCLYTNCLFYPGTLQPVFFDRLRLRWRWYPRQHASVVQAIACSVGIFLARDASCDSAGLKDAALLPTMLDGYSPTALLLPFCNSILCLIMLMCINNPPLYVGIHISMCYECVCAYEYI